MAKSSCGHSLAACVLATADVGAEPALPLAYCLQAPAAPVTATHHASTASLTALREACTSRPRGSRRGPGRSTGWTSTTRGAGEGAHWKARLGACWPPRRPRVASLHLPCQEDAFNSRDDRLLLPRAAAAGACSVLRACGLRHCKLELTPLRRSPIRRAAVAAAELLPLCPACCRLQRCHRVHAHGRCACATVVYHFQGRTLRWQGRLLRASGAARDRGNGEVQGGGKEEGESCKR